MCILIELGSLVISKDPFEYRNANEATQAYKNAHKGIFKLMMKNATILVDSRRRASLVIVALIQ